MSQGRSSWLEGIAPFTVSLVMEYLFEFHAFADSDNGTGSVWRIVSTKYIIGESSTLANKSIATIPSGISLVTKPCNSTVNSLLTIPKL